MKDRKKKIIFYVAAGFMALMLMLAGGAYYVLTRYYFFHVQYLPAKQEMLRHLDEHYDGDFEVLSAEFEQVETDNRKIRTYYNIWTYTLADDKGQQFQCYLWLPSLRGKGAGAAPGVADPLADLYAFGISDTYEETGAESFTYEVAQGEEEYRVSVHDRQDNLLYEASYPKEPVVKKIGKDTLEIYEGAGNTGWSVFVNGETGEVSEPVTDVAACSEETVVYPVFEDGIFKIIIRDIYDERIYREITDNFPPVATGNGFIKEIKVLDYSIYLDYYTGNGANGEEWEEKKVVVENWREGVALRVEQEDIVTESLEISEELTAYWLVLHDKMPFISANEGCQEFYWSQYFWHESGPDLHYKTYDFGIVDLDNDGSRELVMTGAMPETAQILVYQEGKVYSYQTAYRGMAGILTNGVYSGAGASDIGGFYRIVRFDKGTYEEETLAYMERDYFEVEGREVSSEEFFAYTEPFAKGEQIETVDYTEEMLDEMLLGHLDEKQLSRLKHMEPEQICDENNPCMAEVPEVYRDVLKGKKEFICVEKGAFIIDGNCIRIPEGEETDRILYFGIVDMEGDGEAEVVLTCDGKTLVLHAMDGEIYGYEFDFWDEMGEIVKDGVFRLGMGRSQYGRIASFAGDGCTIEAVENYEYTDVDRVRYYFFNGTWWMNQNF